jgi:hypothetical protein
MGEGPGLSQRLPPLELQEVAKKGAQLDGQKRIIRGVLMRREQS